MGYHFLNYKKLKIKLKINKKFKSINSKNYLIRDLSSSTSSSSTCTSTLPLPSSYDFAKNDDSDGISEVEGPVNSNVEHKSPVSRKRKRPNVLRVHKSKFACSNERRELIHEALAKLVSMKQLPISFCSSIGFKNFMAVFEPNYKICKQEAIKARISRLKNLVETKIKENLHQTKSIICTTDGWSSSSQDSYITVTAHTIDLQ